MHDTALYYGSLFFKTYVNSEKSSKILDLGSQDVNGSLRTVASKTAEYIGVDVVDGKGVDVKVTDPYKLPFEDNFFDAAVSSSCFEHTEFFWLSFLELLRVLKPEGLLYINSPSNGPFHRHPVDCWRFYPDSGIALVNWAHRNGFKETALLESFLGDRKNDKWNDFVAVFIKSKKHISAYKKRMTSSFSFKYSNAHLIESEEVLNFKDQSFDQLLINKQKEEINTLNQTLRNKDDEIKKVISSNSYKYTAPLRELRRIATNPILRLKYYKSLFLRKILKRVFLKVFLKLQDSRIKLLIKKILPKTLIRVILKYIYLYNLKQPEPLDDSIYGEIKLINLIKFFPNSKKVILSFVPYDFSFGKFGGGDLIRSTYKTLSKKYNINIVVPTGFENNLEFEELYENVHLYKVPISYSYFHEDYLPYIKVFKTDIFNDILMGERINKLKNIKNLIKVLSLHADYIYCEHGQSYPWLKEYKDIIPIIVNHQNFEYELKKNYFKNFKDSKEAKFLLEAIYRNEKHAVKNCDFNTFVSKRDLNNFDKFYAYNSVNYKIIKNINNI